MADDDEVAALKKKLDAALGKQPSRTTFSLRAGTLIILVVVGLAVIALVRWIIARALAEVF